MGTQSRASSQLGEPNLYTDPQYGEPEPHSSSQNGEAFHLINPQDGKPYFVLVHNVENQTAMPPLLVLFVMPLMYPDAPQDVGSTVYFDISQLKVLTAGVWLEWCKL